MRSNNFESSTNGGGFGRDRSSNIIQKNEREPTKEEKIVLKETIDENARKNFFKRIFPTVEYMYYKQFFEEDRPLNHFIDAKLMGRKRD